MKGGRTIQEKVVFVLCGFVAILASLNALGWILNLQWLVQLAPGLVPMQFNTALGLLFLSLSFVLCHTRHYRIGAAIGLAALVIGVLSLSEWIPGFKLGLDQFFVKSTLVTAQSPIPGRMSPITAACILFFSIGLLGRATDSSQRSRVGLLGVFATFSGLTCVLTLISSITQLGVISEWTQYNQMSIQTGICISLLSVAGFVSACHRSFEGKRIMEWVAASAMLGLLAGTLIWEQAELSQEHRQAAVITNERADATRFQLETLIVQDARALDRMANRIGFGTETTKSGWDQDVNRYMADCPEYEAIEKVGLDSNRWSDARSKGWLHQALDQRSKVRLDLALKKAITTGMIAGSSILDFGKDGHGFVIATPIRNGQKVTGVVAGFFRISEMIKTLPVKTLERYRLEALDNSYSFYRSGSVQPLAGSPVSEATVSTFGTEWTIRMSGNEKLLARIYSPLPKLIFVIGILTSLLLGYLILLAHKARISSTKEKDARRFLENLSEASMTLTYIVDLDRRAMTYCNRYGAQLLGLSPDLMEKGGDEMLRRFVHPEDRASARGHYGKFAKMADGDVLEFEQRLMSADGAWKWMLHRECVHSRNADGTPRTILGVGHDITEIKKAEDSIRQSNEVLERVIDDAAIGMALVSPTGDWLRVNQSLCELVGYSKAELLVTNFQQITHPEDLQVDVGMVAEILSGHKRTYEMEKRYIRKDGKIVWVLLNVTLVRNPEGQPLYFISQILDITERKEASLKLEHYADQLESQKQELMIANHLLEAIATTDGLTGLANRRQFDEELQHLFRSAQRYGSSLSVVLLDIDHFKSVNDRFGHIVGDAVLKKVATILRKGARDSDIVARYGGEEFAVICPHSDLASATFLAQRLRETVEDETFDCGPVTASFGVASLHLSDAEVKDLLNNADAALYQSKRDGRNRVTMAHTTRDSAA